MPDPTRTADPAHTRTADPHGITADFEATGVPGPATPGGPAAPLSNRYVLGPELARGGMGIVCRATDTAFGREVAVKVLQDRFGEGSGAARRFADEARITGQLQHPAIPPVHDLGTLPDGRPFLAMKLIRGDTLADLLAARPSPNHERGRFLAAFEGICHAVAFAHAHGVIHRDLKPQNVMVGNFGEVQVMDWGLAKVLASHDREGAVPADPDATAAGTDIRTTRNSEDLLTQAGSVLGTPAYMPPEQAVGAIDRIDRRSDVFGLGGILAAILTGKPPFVGTTSEGTRQLAAKGKLEECLARLAACQAEPEWVALCVSCLKVEKEDRPSDADAVAKAVAGLRAAADERARKAELERVAEALRATEQRKRRRVQRALAAAVGLLVVGGGAVAWWQERQASDRRTADLQRQYEDDKRAADESARLGRNADAVKALLDAAHTALAAGDIAKTEPLLDAAAKRADEGGADDQRGRIADYRAEVQFFRELAAAERFRWNMGLYNLRYGDRLTREVSAALARFGAEPGAADPPAVGRRVARAAARDQFVSAFDDMLWSAKDPWVRDVLRTADPDPFRDEFRDALFAKDRERLAALSTDRRAFDLPIGFLVSFVTAPALETTDAQKRVVRVVTATDGRKRELLKHALVRHPNDVHLLLALAQLARTLPHDGHEEQLVWAQAAVAAAPANPVSWNNLSVVLLDRREFARAEAAARESIRLDPADSVPWGNLGSVLVKRGDPAGAEAAFKEGLRLDPKDVLLHNNRAAVLQARGDLKGAVAACEEAIRLNDQCAPAYANLGVMLLDLDDLKGAEAAHRKALELWPEYHHAHLGLGNVLLDKGDVKGAEAAFRESIRLNPREPNAHYNLGILLRQKGKLADAEASHREAIRLDPTHAPAFSGLGNVLRDKGDLPGAVTALKESARLRPKYPAAHDNLGIVLAMSGDLDGAIAAFEEALRLSPNNQGTATNLNKVRRMKADREAKAKPRELAPPPRPVW